MIDELIIYLDNGRSVYCEPTGKVNLRRLSRLINEATMVSFDWINVIAEIQTNSGQKEIDYLNSRRVIGIKIERD